MRKLKITRATTADGSSNRVKNGIQNAESGTGFHQRRLDGRIRTIRVRQDTLEQEVLTVPKLN